MRIPFDDESHIVYADATYNGFDGALGDVLHDFLCADPEQMRCGVLDISSSVVLHLKMPRCVQICSECIA